MNHMRFNEESIRYISNADIFLLTIADALPKVFRVAIKRRLRDGSINMDDTVSIQVDVEGVRAFQSDVNNIDIDQSTTIEADIKTILNMMYDDRCQFCSIRDICSKTTVMPCELLAKEALYLVKDMSIN